MRNKTNSAPFKLTHTARTNSTVPFKQRRDPGTEQHMAELTGHPPLEPAPDPAPAPQPPNVDHSTQSPGFGDPNRDPARRENFQAQPIDLPRPGRENYPVMPTRSRDEGAQESMQGAYRAPESKQTTFSKPVERTEPVWKNSPVQPVEQRYTKEEHETNQTNNDAIDQEMLAYKQAYYDKHGSSSGGSDEEWAAYQAGLDKLRSGYVNR